jgi:glycosyltransferase involved in cell wall biosynthesis
MVATPSLADDLAKRGFKRLLAWTRGVDTERFRPQDVRLFGADQPVFLYVGRVSKEKNIEAFLDADLPGRKVVVGSGPHLSFLRRRYPQVVFTGTQSGEELARHYASADVFVFPSRTDTFGLVLLEAMACGLPVAAYPVTGPIDVVVDGVTGCLADDLGVAARAALRLDRQLPRAHAVSFSWQRTAELFLQNIDYAVRKSAAKATPVTLAYRKVARGWAHTPRGLQPRAEGDPRV